MLAHARALLTSTPQGRSAYIEADLCDPERILAAPDIAETLDFAQPTAVMLLGILYFIRDDQDPYGVVARLMAATAPGSYLVISHPASDVHAEVATARARRYAKMMGRAQTNRSRQEVGRFFDGLELLEPGIVQANRWRPAAGSDVDTVLSNWCGMARKT